MTPASPSDSARFTASAASNTRTGMPTRKTPFMTWSRRIKAEASSASINRRTRLLRRSAPRPPCARYKPRSLTMGVELPASARCCAFSATSSETNVGDRKLDPTSPPSMSRQLRTRNSREPTTCSKVSPCRQKPAPLIPTISLDQHRILAFSARNFRLNVGFGSPRHSQLEQRKELSKIHQSLGFVPLFGGESLAFVLLVE